MVKIVKEPIDIEELFQLLKSESAGSIVLFIGEPRKGQEDGPVISIEYSAYEEMAVRELEKIEASALKRKGIYNVVIVHRIEDIPLKEISLFVGVSSAHREEGFQAAQWIVDEIKKTVPIWKEIKYEGSWNGKER